MPNRIIKESVCTSDTLNQLSWFEEVCWYRLIVSCDDYGRMDARPAILRATMFPLNESVTTKSLMSALDKMASIGLVVPYEVNGKPYVYLPSWGEHQRVRDSKEKYPAPQCAASCGELPRVAASCRKLPRVAASCGELPRVAARAGAESESNPNPNPKGNITPLPPLDEFSEPMQEAIRNWLSYKDERREKYKPTGLTQFISMTRNAVSKYGEDAVLYAFTHSMGANYQGIVWEKAQKFKAEPPDNYYERLN